MSIKQWVCPPEYPTENKRDSCDWLAQVTQLELVLSTQWRLMGSKTILDSVTFILWTKICWAIFIILTISSIYIHICLCGICFLACQKRIRHCSDQPFRGQALQCGQGNRWVKVEVKRKNYASRSEICHQNRDKSICTQDINPFFLVMVWLKFDGPFLKDNQESKNSLKIV